MFSMFRWALLALFASIPAVAQEEKPKIELSRVFKVDDVFRISTRAEGEGFSSTMTVTETTTSVTKDGVVLRFRLDATQLEIDGLTEESELFEPLQTCLKKLANTECSVTLDASGTVLSIEPGTLGRVIGELDSNEAVANIWPHIRLDFTPQGVVDNLYRFTKVLYPVQSTQTVGNKWEATIEHPNITDSVGESSTYERVELVRVAEGKGNLTFNGRTSNGSEFSGTAVFDQALGRIATQTDTVELISEDGTSKITTSKVVERVVKSKTKPKPDKQ